MDDSKFSGDTNYPLLRLWATSLFSGARLRWIIFRLPSFIFIPIELKSLTVKVVLVRVVLYFFLLCKPLQGLKSNNSWVGGNIWGLPLISSQLISEFSLLGLNKVSTYVEKRELSSFYTQMMYNNLSYQSRYEGGWGIKFSLLLSISAMGTNIGAIVN